MKQRRFRKHTLHCYFTVAKPAKQRPARPLNEYRVSVTITRVYTVVVEARNKGAAYRKVDDMQTYDIHRDGKLEDATVDSIEVE